jgi:signal transduction histidine kinase/CheY-like chemotaxis protein/HAMP domain-containing protein
MTDLDPQRPVLDRSALEQLLAGLTAVRGGDFGTRLALTGDPFVDEIAAVFNGMAHQLDLFTTEVTRVAREVGTEGQLGGQAHVPGVSGTWKDLTESVNAMARNLTTQVRSIAQVATAVAMGDLTRNIAVDAQGEVAELKDNLNAMVQSLREAVQASQEQDWLKTNLARIGSMMQGHRDLEVVAELIMEELAPLLGAQHGTFFLTEESDGDARLRLIAGYGLRADKDAPIQYRIGQSLIGQVAKSKRAIVVDEIPPGYIKISSGLGEAPPANLAVLPLVFEDQVLGVMELASFTRFTPIQVAFLEQFTETLGVSVNAIIANARTDALLGQSQRLTAELQARSSELQSRSEELQTTNADLEEKAAQLAEQKRDIETKNEEISRAREEIEERARQLALASQYKSQFLANMSHELRTPLNSLLILARLLAQNTDQNLTVKQVEYANVIHSAGSDLLQLINDILDLSKVEAGRLDVHPEPFALSALVEDLQATFGPLTAEKGLDFAVSIAPSAPAELVTDRARLRQVLGNLLSNAVKFTDRGQIVLQVRADAEDDSVVTFSVTDTGIGIAPENLAAIFGAFQQGDGTLSRRYGGTGLGLSIASEVSALLGGRITAQSDLGRGSTFTLHLPTTLPESSPSVSWPDGPSALADLEALDPGAGLRLRTAGARIAALVAASAPEESGQRGSGAGESAPDGSGPTGLAAGESAASEPATREPATGGFSAPNRKVLVFEGASGGLLTLLAHSAISDLTEVSGTVSVSTATSPAQGVAMLAAEPFQCVVIDLGAPIALEFLAQVQEKPELSDIPVLAHAAEVPDGGVRGRLEALRAGYQALELLPSLDELRERITLRLSAQAAVAADAADAADAASSAAAGHQGLRGKHVLVIDDDLRNVFAINSTLELHGMRVTCAADGRQGIEALLAAPETDLILMDIMMPGMDGYATMTVIRQMPQFAQLPIIAVTARAMPGDRDKSLSAGASDYVTKPVNTDELLSCMERWLSRS